MPAKKVRFIKYLPGPVLAVWLVLLLIVQAGLYSGRLQPVNSWYGAVQPTAAVAVVADDAPYGIVTWELVGSSRLEAAVLCRNGQAVQSFGKPQVTVRVYAGDVLSIDATAYLKPVRICLKKVSSGIDKARLLTDVEVCGERMVLGNIRWE